MIILALCLCNCVGFLQYKEDISAFLRENVMMTQSDIHCPRKKIKDNEVENKRRSRSLTRNKSNKNGGV